MYIFKFSLKIIGQIIFVITFFSTSQAKNMDKFNKADRVSDYFSGILLLNDNQYSQSYKFLKKLEGLEESHIGYASEYLFSLVNAGKFNEAFDYSKKLEKRELDNFESNLIIGIYYLKSQKNDLAQKYFLKLKNRKSNFVINDFVSNSLLNCSDCEDDNGTLEPFGGCFGAISILGCDFDFAGDLISELCPVSCENCFTPLSGCTDPEAYNWNPWANFDLGFCDLPIEIECESGESPIIVTIVPDSYPFETAWEL